MMKTKFHFGKFTLGLIFGLQLAGVGLIFSCPLPALAQTSIQSLNFVPQVSIPNSEFNGSVSVGSYQTATGIMSSDLLARYVKAFYNYGLTIAGILAAIVLMGGGLIWLTSGGDSGKVGQAKELITGSIVGIVILVCAWVILNTINPNLVNLQPIETTVVKKISYCCDSTLGNVPMDKDGKCTSGMPCEGDSVCISTKTANQTTASFSCINKTDYGCCEWSLNNTQLYCLAIKKGDSCPKTSPKAGYSYTTFHQQWCATGDWNVSSGNCLNRVAPCVGKDNTTGCYDGANGTCYNEQCWVGTGEKGEPCGNDAEAKCFEGSLSNMCPDYYSHDAAGGRMCTSGKGLYCCYPTPNSK